MDESKQTSKGLELVRAILVGAVLGLSLWCAAPGPSWAVIEEFEFSAPRLEVGYRLPGEEAGLYGGAQPAKMPWDAFCWQTDVLVDTPLPKWAAVPRGILLPPLPARKSLWGRLKEGFEKNIVISGHQIVTYNKGSISGNLASYSDDNYGNERALNTVTDIYVRGKLFNYFDLDMAISRNRFAPSEHHLNFRYDHRGTRVEYGTLALSVTGNELVSFSKRVKGFSAEIPLWWGGAKFVKSKARSRAKTKTLTGNNTSGPYYLGFFPIEDGSERIRIDNQDVPSDQYQIHYETGILYFREDMIIPETSTIEVVFEVKTTSLMGGEISGMRVWQRIGQSLTVAYTRLSQATGAGGESEELSWTDAILGDGTGGPYQLYHGPVVPGSEEVRLEGKVQERDVDYRIDYDLGLVYFFFSIGIEQNILVAYKQRVERALAADRTVIGYEAVYQPNPDSTLWWSYGRSNADAEGKPGGGSASILRGAFNFYRGGEGGRRLPLAVINTQFKDIQPGFATIENASFRRNEKGNSSQVVLTPWDHVRMMLVRDKVKRPMGLSSISGQEETFLHFGNSLYTLDLDFPKWPAVTLSRTKTTNRDLSPEPKVSTALTTDVMNLRYKLGNLSLSGGRTGQQNRNELADEYASRSKTSRAGAAYRAGKSFAVTTDYSKSKIEGSTGTATTASTRRLGLVYNPFLSLSLTADFSSQISGGTVAGPPGGSFGGLGRLVYDASAETAWLDRTRAWQWRGPASRQDDGEEEPRGSVQTSRRYGLTWSPGKKKFTLTINVFNSVQDAAYTSNSDHKSTALTVSWRPSERIETGMALSKQTVEYLAEDGGMDVKSAIVWATLGPYWKYTIELGASAFDTTSDLQFGGGFGGSSPGSQESMIRDLNLSIRRPISKRADAYLRWQRSQREGFGSFMKTTAEVGVSHRFSEVASFTLTGSTTIYHDLIDPGYDYTARLLTARMNLHF